MPGRRIVAIGGSDAGISAALRARELDPTAEVTVVVADAYPNFSICGIPYYVSGEVTHWTNLAHRTADDLAATGMRVLTDTRAIAIDVPGQSLAVTGPDGGTYSLDYDALIVGTGAVSARPPIAGLTGPDALGPKDGVHLLHSMGDTFEVMDSITSREPKTAVIIGAGYIGLDRDGRRIDHPRDRRHPDRSPPRSPPDRRPRARRTRAHRTRTRRRRGRHRHDGLLDRPRR